MKFACVFAVGGERSVLGAVEADSLMEACGEARFFAYEEYQGIAEMSCFNQGAGIVAFPPSGGSEPYVLVLPVEHLTHLGAGCRYSDDYKAELVAQAAAFCA